MSQPASSVYTRLGDDGSTGRLFGGRLSKDHPLVDACGDIDETVSALGLAREALSDDPETAELVLRLQRDLFVVPGATRASAGLDQARSVCRRAERAVVRAGTNGAPPSAHVLVFLNRLSDLLYVLARRAAGSDAEPVSHS
jgi:cob(I)alamin adenosyltransferase